MIGIIILITLLFYMRNFIATVLTITILVYALEHHIPGFWQEIGGLAWQSLI